MNPEEKAPPAPTWGREEWPILSNQPQQNPNPYMSGLSQQNPNPHLGSLYASASERRRKAFAVIREHVPEFRDLLDIKLALWIAQATLDE